MLQFLVRLTLLALLAAPSLALAQGASPRPVKIVVPFPPGGGVDALGRIIQPGLQEQARPAGDHREQGGRRRHHRRRARGQSPKDGLTI